MPKNGGSHNLQRIPFLILIHLNLIGYKDSHRDLSKYFQNDHDPRMMSGE